MKYCPECGGETLEGSVYCSLCGKPIKRDKEETDSFDRVPCSDGSCIGTLNESGVCGVCGKPYNGDPVG